MDENQVKITIIPGKSEDGGVVFHFCHENEEVQTGIGVTHRVYICENDGIHLDFETAEGNGDVRYIAATNFVEGRSVLRQPVLPVSVAIRGKGHHHVMRYRMNVRGLEITGVITLDSLTETATAGCMNLTIVENEIQAQNYIVVKNCAGFDISA